MSNNAQYASTVRSAAAALSAANTNRDGTGTIVDVTTGATNGTRIDDIYITATSTTTAGMIRFYITDGSAVTRLWKEVVVTANTPSSTNPAWTSSLLDLALILQSTWKLRASTNNAEAFNVHITRGGDF